MIYYRRFRPGAGRREWLSTKQANGGRRRDGTDRKACPKDALWSKPERSFHAPRLLWSPPVSPVTICAAPC